MQQQTTKRHYSVFDQICLEADKGLKTLFSQPRQSNRRRPDHNVVLQQALTEKEMKLSGRLMRVNHSGEICAQALYQGQAMVAYQRHIQDKLKQAADEENDHLAWCEQRLEELDTHTSYLNPLWYTGSLMIGVLAGITGDQYSLGFLEETERQVEAHLKGHMDRLPQHDEKSHLIIQQMKDDEVQHANTAQQAGAKKLPWFVKKAMQVVSKVMTKTSFFV